MKERESEDRLIFQVQSFILELGYGFCFIGREHRLALVRRSILSICPSTTAP